MTDFNALISKINEFSASHHASLAISGVNSEQWAFLHNQLFRNHFKDTNFVFICEKVEHAETFYAHLNVTDKLLLTGNESNLYNNYIPSEIDLFYKFSNLFDLASNPDKRRSIVTDFESLSSKLPPRSFFQDELFEVQISDIIGPTELAKKLVHLGYISGDTIEEPGQFSRRGEVFDIFTTDNLAFRIIYFDDMVEEIIKIDIHSKRSLNSEKYESIKIPATPRVVLRQEFIQNLRKNIPIPQAQFKDKFHRRREILLRLNDGNLFESYPNFIPLFFEENSSLLDFLEINKTLFIIFNSEENIKGHELYLEEARDTYELEVNDTDSDQILPSPEKLYDLNSYQRIINFKNILVNDLQLTSEDLVEQSTVNLKLIPTSIFFTKNTKLGRSALNKFEYVKSLLEAIGNLLKSQGHLYVLYRNQSSKEEINYLLQENEIYTKLKGRVEFIQMQLDEGFYYQNGKVFVLTESDLFGARRKKTSRKKAQSSSTDLFAEQLSTLSKGDYVVHKEHGVGIYEGLETLDYNGIKSDYLTINYAGTDRVYVPVYKLDLIQKYADSSHKVTVSSLKSNKFDKTKTKARQSVKKLAFDLLELQAKRKLKEGYSFSEPDHIYKEFELSFSFEETPDQQRAIDDIISDMTSKSPMDRLVCGDVGFGKTEVAMRAAFKSVLDQKQVAVLVPTTVLAYQHYNTFVERMKDFPINIEFISRFKTAKQVRSILLELEEGRVDIVIGTHKLLSDQVKYKDLGLVIIDEEHRFGVGHKEKLKLLKENIDCLTLTATPIPRTLQLSFLGIRDLSLIQTAPPRRQSIKTYLVKDDLKTIKTAIEKEMQRGGQVFIVHNRVHDIEEYAARICKQVPNAKLVIAHGQMKERELETKIRDFYDKKFDILLATTIIESGIDIPSANTMIIDRADTYGLAQLHQLRGRIGRSNKKAYAYFMVPKDRNLTGNAARRLKALQTYAEMGSGFSIASSDMEIRGSGDILGAEQSGHIQNIGLELYMELLQEAINEIKGNNLQSVRSNLEISTPFDAFIPDQYIQNAAKRLKYYKRISNCKSVNVLNDIHEELQDFYGLIPKQLENLFIILESRIHLNKLGISNVKVASKSITINFNQDLIDKNDQLKSNILKFFMERPKVYKLSPDYSVRCSFKDVISQKDLLEFSKYIAEQIHPC